MRSEWEGGPLPWNMCSLRFPTSRAKSQTLTCLAVEQLVNALLAYLAAINTIAALAAIIILGLSHVVMKRDIIDCKSEKEGCEEKMKCEAGGSRCDRLEARAALCLKPRCCL